MAQEIRGFYDYYWRPRYGYKKHEYEYVHTKLDPDAKDPPIRITVDTIERGRSYRDPDKLLFKINNKGKGIQKEFQVKEQMEKSLGEIFAELLKVNGIDFLFDCIFEDK